VVINNARCACARELSVGALAPATQTGALAPVVFIMLGALAPVSSSPPMTLEQGRSITWGVNAKGRLRRMTADHALARGRNKPSGWIGYWW